MQLTLSEKLTVTVTRFSKTTLLLQLIVMKKDDIYFALLSDCSRQKLPKFEVRVRQRIPNEHKLACLHQLDSCVLPNHLQLKAAKIFQERRHNQGTLKGGVNATIRAMPTHFSIDEVRNVDLFVEADKQALTI